jgi:mono/diheme cytochrome c family protein
MKLAIRGPHLLALAAFLAASAMTAWAQRIKDLPPAARVKMPALSAQAVAGQKAYDATCAACHGVYGLGTKQGPPLLDPIYNPGHHADESFLRAVRQGVQQHHWQFGNMPPMPHVSDAQLFQIVRYVRELQEANGIKTAPHRM